MKNDEQILKIVLIGGIGLVGIALIIKLINDSKRNNSSKRVIDDENVSIATQLNTAIHTGRNWATDLFKPADKETIFRLASEIKNYEDVATEYKNLYNTSLTLELQDALGEDYPKFLEKVGKVIKGQDIISDREAEELANDLFDDMDGLNWLGHNKKPYIKLLRLSDNNFKKVIEIFNAKYQDEDFKTMFSDEFGVSWIYSMTYTLIKDKLIDDYTWDEIQKKVMERYNQIYNGK